MGEQPNDLAMFLLVVVLPALAIIIAARAVWNSRRAEREQASRRVREQLEQAQRIANIGSWEWDFKTGELTWSDQCYRIVGWEVDGSKPTFERFLASVHPDDRARLQETVRNGVEEGLPCCGAARERSPAF